MSIYEWGQEYKKVSNLPAFKEVQKLLVSILLNIDIYYSMKGMKAHDTQSHTPMLVMHYNSYFITFKYFVRPLSNNDDMRHKYDNIWHRMKHVFEI